MGRTSLDNLNVNRNLETTYFNAGLTCGILTIIDSALKPKQHEVSLQELLLLPLSENSKWSHKGFVVDNAGQTSFHSCRLLYASSKLLKALSKKSTSNS